MARRKSTISGVLNFCFNAPKGIKDFIWAGLSYFVFSLVIFFILLLLLSWIGYGGFWWLYLILSLIVSLVPAYKVHGWLKNRLRYVNY